MDVSPWSQNIDGVLAISVGRLLPLAFAASVDADAAGADDASTPRDTPAYMAAMLYHYPTSLSELNREEERR